MSQGFGSNDYYGGGGYMSPSQGSPGGSARKAARDTIRPVTVEQLRRATQTHTDAEWTIGNHDVAGVTIVGQAISVNAQTTNTTYLIDDGYGKLEARHWTDTTSEDGENTQGIAENDYVRVSGTLKSFGNKRYINASHVRKIDDFHELYFHLLDAMSITLTLERGPPPKPGQAFTPQLAAGGPSAYTAQSNAGASDQWSHLPALHQKIVTFIVGQPRQEDGVHVGAIARHVGGEAATISEALDKLMDDGVVYTTLDESHFAVSL